MSILIVFFLLAASCKNNSNKDSVTFFENYSFKDHKGIIKIDTTKANLQKLSTEGYYIEHKLNDSIRYIYLVDKKASFFMDTANCTRTTNYTNSEVQFYYGKYNEVSKSDEKTSISVSAYYENDTLQVSISELFLCEPLSQAADKSTVLSGYLSLRNDSFTSFHFCIYPSDTVNLIENFKSIQKIKAFKRKLETFRR